MSKEPRDAPPALTAPTEGAAIPVETWPHPVEQMGYVLNGRYRLEERIASGAMGSIWRGCHLALKAPVAIKFLDVSVARETEMHSRFLQEGRSAAAVRCANVVQVFDYGKDANTPPFIVMELLEGETLEQRLLKRKLLSPAELDEIFRQVAAGISRAHAIGIVHRDLKPSNIFIAREGPKEVTKLIDFGIAKVDERRLGFTPRARTKAGTVIGTPEYMSPEQLRAGTEVDLSVDLWALAIIAFECLTGKLPFAGKSITDLAVQICTEKPLAPSALAQVPAGFDRWFAKATQREIESRFSSADEMAAALSLVLQGATAAPALSPRPLLTAELWRYAAWLSPRRAGALALACAAAAAIYLFRPAPAPLSQAILAERARPAAPQGLPPPQPEALAKPTGPAPGALVPAVAAEAPAAAAAAATAPLPQRAASAPPVLASRRSSGDRARGSAKAGTPPSAAVSPAAVSPAAVSPAAVSPAAVSPAAVSQPMAARPAPRNRLEQSSPTATPPEAEPPIRDPEALFAERQ
jgi:serine/threonine-protein kinase